MYTVEIEFSIMYTHKCVCCTTGVDINRNFPLGFGLGADEEACSEVFFIGGKLLYKFVCLSLS